MTQMVKARSRWGRSRFGGSSTALITVSLARGAFIAAGTAVVFMLLNDVQRPGLVLVVFVACMLPAAIALVWAVLVDRSTLAGAVDKPEDSVESAWYDTAASGAFGDVLAIGGLGAAVFALSPLEMRADLVLLAVVVVSTGDFAARYWRLQKSAG